MVIYEKCDLSHRIELAIFYYEFTGSLKKNAWEKVG